MALFFVIRIIKDDQKAGARHPRYQEEKALERKEAFDEGRNSQQFHYVKGMLTVGRKR